MGRYKKDRSSLKDKRFVTPNELSLISGKHLTTIFRWKELDKYLITRNVYVKDVTGHHYYNEEVRLIDRFDSGVIEFVNQ